MLFFIFFSCSSQNQKAEDPCSLEPNLQNLTLCHDKAFNSFNKNPEDSIKTFEKLCLKNSLARACSNLAYFFENPKGSLVRNQKQSFDYYSKACDLKDGVACHNLANIYIQGLNGNPIDLNLAVSLLQKSCEYNYASACYRLAIIKSNGKLLPNHPKDVTAFMKKGCELGDVISCHDLAYRYIGGEGVEVNNRYAMELLKFSCDNNFARGCSSLGSFFMMGDITEVNYPEALRLLQKACSLDEASACTNLGYMYEMGKGIKIDLELAAKYSEQACRLGDAFGCGNLGNLYARGMGVEKNEKTALPLLSKGCSEKNAESCRYLAQFHAKGLGGLPKVLSTSLFYKKLACEYGDKESCEQMSQQMSTLCHKDELISFSCNVDKVQNLSLCLSKNKEKKHLLTYRFGKKRLSEQVSFRKNFKVKIEKLGLNEKYELTFIDQYKPYKITELISKSSDPVTRKIQIELSYKDNSFMYECLFPIKGSISDQNILDALNVN